MPVCPKCGQTRQIEVMQGDICMYCNNIASMKLDDEAIDRDRQMLTRDRTASVSVDTVDKVAQSVVLTTAFDIPNREIGEIVDIVGADVAMGMNIFKDIANAFRDTFGGRSNTVQTALRDARAQCIVELRREAFRLGADAVIAVRFAYNEASVAGGTGGGILFVSATGTAVTLADQPQRQASPTAI